MSINTLLLHLVNIGGECGTIGAGAGGSSLASSSIPKSVVASPAPLISPHSLDLSSPTVALGGKQTSLDDNSATKWSWLRRSVEGLTPVHVAAAWGKVSLLYLLLVNGGDPWLLDEDRNNAFHYALQERHWDVLQLLHRFRLRDKLSDDSVKYTITLSKIISKLLNEITSVCKSREIGNIVNNSDNTNDAVQVTSDNNLVVCSGYKTNQSDDILVDSLHIDSSDVRQTQSNLYNCDIVTPSLLAVEDTFLSSMEGDYATCNEYDSLSKEYIYLDQEEGVALLERILPVKSELEVLPPCPVLSDVPSWCLTDPSQGPAVIWPGY
uniref:Uncharacterized protein n=1 Tax=Timema tahoe TaxID=61484 RepID=A0A7R9NX61_9NEOP|nr:unnamed protein product [Timema tahoe]